VRFPAVCGASNTNLAWRRRTLAWALHSGPPATTARCCWLHAPGALLWHRSLHRPLSRLRLNQCASILL